MNGCPFELYIPDVGICCKAYYESKRLDGKDWCHFPRCYDDICPLTHPELLEGAILEVKDYETLDR